jgi:putative flavoprotein involved in K+ transport
VLGRIDQAIARLGLSSEVYDREWIPSVGPIDAPDALDLSAAGITSIVWATGHRRPYEWLDLPILDQRGEVRQYRGVTPLRGAYVLGQRFQHHRNSNFIDGVGRDAQYIAEHIDRSSRTPHRRGAATPLTPAGQLIPRRAHT